jgi:thiol-disulfide isomerase/thioredoxin
MSINTLKHIRPIPMKYFSLLVLQLINLIANAQISLKTDSVFISGHVKNYHKDSKAANSVMFIINDLVQNDQITYRAKIKNDGSYLVSFVKTGAQDIMMEYNETIQSTIVSPGDRMQIDFDAKEYLQTCSFHGDNAVTNQDARNYDIALKHNRKAIYGDDDYARFKALSASEKDNQPEAHKQYLTEHYNKELTFLESYLASRKSSLTFAKWAKADLKYEYLENLMRYTWLHPTHNKQKEEDFTIPESYFDFVTKVDLDDPNASISSHYGSYITEYARFITLKKLGYNRRIDTEINFYVQQPSSFLKDIMLCSFFNNLIQAKHTKLLTPYISEFESNVTQLAFKKRVLSAYNSALSKLNHYTLPQNAIINTNPITEADSIFNKITAKYAGKVVYLDFWATWCGPCRAEMPDAQKLRRQFAGKDVVFLYLGVESEAKTWKALISELNIQGEHFLLNNNQFNAISEKFSINGIPRYLLIDKGSQVVDDDAKRPSDTKLLKDITDLLEAK